MRLTMLASLFYLAVVSTPVILAQAPAPSSAPVPAATAPALTDVQRLRVQNALQAIEIAQLHAQAAQAEFEKARGSATELLKALDVAGYTLDLSTLAYVKKADPKRETPDK